MKITVIIISMAVANRLHFDIHSNTYTNVQKNAGSVYRVQRYHLIKEFYNHLPVPPPLIILNHIILVVRAVIRCCCKKHKTKENWFSKCSLVYIYIYIYIYIGAASIKFIFDMQLCVSGNIRKCSAFVLLRKNVR